MLDVPIHEAKAKLSSLIALAEKGEEVVFTRHGKRVVRLMAETVVDDRAARRSKAEALVASLRAGQSTLLPLVPGYNDLATLLALSKAQQR